LPVPDREGSTAERRSGKATAARWSVIIAAAGLLLALGFNGVQVRDSARAQNQARLATELGLLTQLQNVMSESVYRRVQFAPQFRQMRAGRRGSLTPPAYRATAEEAANMDYLAWLFNSGHLTVEGADQLWGPRMICEYQRAFAPSLATPAQDLPDLLEFIRQRGSELTKLNEGC
jgi:hypothetical protein